MESSINTMFYIVHNKFTNCTYELMYMDGTLMRERINGGRPMAYILQSLNVDDFLRDEEWNFCLYIFLKFLKIFSVQEKDRM